MHMHIHMHTQMYHYCQPEDLDEGVSHQQRHCTKDTCGLTDDRNAPRDLRHGTH